MNQKRIVDVVAAVIEHDGRILACRRRPQKAAGGKWEFPGGKIEPLETPETALVREIREELGIDIEVVSQLRTDETQVGNSVIRLICLRARLMGEAPVASLDHDEMRWLAPESLYGLDWAAPDLPAVAELTSHGVD